MESQPLRKFVIAIVWLIGSCGALAAETLRVPQDYKSIEAAIDSAKAGDTVLVSPGTYKERIHLKEGLTVKSAGDDAKGNSALRGPRQPSWMEAARKPKAQAS